MTDATFHGGDVGWAEARFGHPAEPWLDLSTGINPWPYPVGPIPDDAWTRLPEPGAVEALCAAASRYYGAPATNVVAAPGSQALIQLLPRLRPIGRVAVIGPTYGEHAPCWAAAGHEVTATDADALDGDRDVVVVTNPNNPDGAALDPARLDGAADRLAARGGWLVVDEAFADVAPHLSLAPSTGRAGRIVMRSFGKFFGLAGIRLGFALAPADIARAIATALGPWAVSGPALAVATQALADEEWIDATRDRLAAAAERLQGVLDDAGLTRVGGTALYRLVEHPSAPAMFQTLGENGILVRHFPERPERLRFGLAPDDAGLERIARALAASRAAVS